MENKALDVAKINQQVLEFQKGAVTSPYYGEGVVLVKNISKGTTSGGNPKYSGIIANNEEARFQIWNNKAAFDIAEEGKVLPGESVVYITYEIGKFGLIINSMEFVEGWNPSDFITQRYDVGDKMAEFQDALKNSGATQKAKDIIESLLHMGLQDVIEKRVKMEYAALSHHDNCQTGLLAHMTKCIQLYNGVKVPYSFFLDERTNDLMVIALAIHDIGKIFEMHNGTYQKYSFITHRGLGTEYLLKHKETIVKEYDEEFFYMLLSVIQQHHGEYGEKPRTLYACLVHMIDNMEATFSSVDEMLQKAEYTSDAAGTKVKLNDSYLNIFRVKLSEE